MKRNLVDTERFNVINGWRSEFKFLPKVAHLKERLGDDAPNIGVYIEFLGFRFEVVTTNPRRATMRVCRS